jgi:hypothetical protein
MTFAQLLNELASHSIGITINSNSIKTNVPASKIPDHIKEVLKLNKDEIIAIMQKPLKSFEMAPDLVEASIALGGVVTGKVDEVPGELITVVYEDGVIATKSRAMKYRFEMRRAM